MWPDALTNAVLQVMAGPDRSFAGAPCEESVRLEFKSPNYLQASAELDSRKLPTWGTESKTNSKSEPLKPNKGLLFSFCCLGVPVTTV